MSEATSQSCPAPLLHKTGQSTAKEKADNLRPEFILQYQDCDMDMTVLLEAAKADFHKAKKHTLVTDLRLYIKPKEHTAYYKALIICCTACF